MILGAGSICSSDIVLIQVQVGYCSDLIAVLVLHCLIQVQVWYCTNLGAGLVLHRSRCRAGIARHRMPDPQSGSSCAQPQTFFWLYICHYFYISRQKCAPFGKYCTASLPDLRYNSTVLSIFCQEYFSPVSGDYGCLIYLVWQTCLVFTAACICQDLRVFPSLTHLIFSSWNTQASKNSSSFCFRIMECGPNVTSCIDNIQSNSS